VLRLTLLFGYGFGESNFWPGTWPLGCSVY